MYEYTKGKSDWLAAGLPIEGSNARRKRAADVARTDAPVARPNETVGDAAKRTREAGFDACVVCNDVGVVIGLLRSEELAGDAGERVEEAMRPGPSTFRPNVPIAEMAHYMVEHELENAPITTSDGKLVGLLLRDDAVKAAHESHEHDD